MDRESLEGWIVRRMSDSLGIPDSEFDAAVPFARLGVDSMLLVGLAAELERQVGREIDPQLLFQCRTPRDLAINLCAGG